MKKLLVLGFKAWIFPILKFRTGKDLHLLPEKISFLQKKDIVISVSKQAVFYSQKKLKKNKKKWPNYVNYFTMSYYSAIELNKYTKSFVNFPNTKNNSEELLKKIFLIKELKKRKILLLKGNKGRKKIEKTLKKKGYSIEKIECYKRIYKKFNVLKKEKKWRFFKINTLIFTSNNMLLYFYYSIANLKETKWIFNCTIFCISEKMEQTAKTLGWKHIVLCRGANNFYIIEKIHEKNYYFSAKEDLNL